MFEKLKESMYFPNYQLESELNLIKMPHSKRLNLRLACLYQKSFRLWHLIFECVKQELLVLMLPKHSLPSRYYCCLMSLLRLMVIRFPESDNNKLSMLCWC